DDGIGFSFDGGPNVLFEGALMLGRNSTHVVDAARVSSEHTDFAPGLHDLVQKTTGPQAAQEIHAAFTDSITTGSSPLNVRVALSSWASATAPHNDFVVVEYDVKNRTVAPIDSLWAALFCDWDIDANHVDTNRTAYDAARHLGYAWDTSTPSLPYVGVMSLSGIPYFSAILNNGPGPVIPNDGFSKAEKWDILQAGTGVTSAGPGDISNAPSTGPYKVAAGGHAAIFFALLAAPNLA